MQKTIVLKLDKKSSKPVFDIDTNDNTLRCMFDTGSGLSVWCSGLCYFKLCFPNCKRIDYKMLVYGFGNSVIESDVYVIPEFRIKDLCFKQFYVAIIDTEVFSWDLILGYPLFKKVDYSFINRGKNAPFLKIVFDRDAYYTGVLYKHYKNNKVVCNPYVFTADSEKDNSRELIDAFEEYITQRK